MYRIGTYVLSQRIGAGGMAEVWMAHRATAGAKKILAVKLLAPNLASMKKYREMFLEEARLSMLLNHSNIVQVFDAGEEHGESFMAMEWVDGVNLAELQAALWEMGRAMPVEVAMYITGEVLRALDYAHNVVHDGAATIVHRDVSPANIMLSMSGEVKLTDFGVARFGTEETSGMHVKGKLRYMAPEQLRGSSKSGSVDVFSIGAVLHEMLEGGKFRGSSKDECELLHTAFEGAVPDLRERSEISPELESLRRWMLAPEVGERVASAREALHGMRQCPGYRDASHELGALVSWYRSNEACMAQRSGGHGQLGSATPNGQGSDTSISRMLPLATGPRSWSRAYANAGQRWRLFASAIIALFGLCVGCVGIGFGVKEMGKGEEPVAVAEPPQVITASPVVMTPADEPAPQQDREPPPKHEDQIEVVDPPAAAKVEEPQVAEAEQPDQKEQPPPPKPGHVEFLAGKFNFIYLKVAGKQKVAQPGVKLSLKPGTHKVYGRTDPAQKWVYHGKVQVRSGQTQKVLFTKPDGLKVIP